MKKSSLILKLAVFITTLMFLSCATTPKKTLQLRKITDIELSNGLKILVVPDHSLPRVSLNLMVQVGSALEEAGYEGVNSLTLAMIEQGTSTRSATQIADDFAQIGSELNQSSGYDFSTISSSSLSVDKGELLSLFSDVVMNPSFSSGETDRKKNEFIATIKKQRDQPSSYADILFAQALYDSHPYAHSPIGNLDSIKSLSRSDLLKHYFKFYRPNNSRLAIVGDIDDAFIEKVKSTFEKWSAKPVMVNPVPVPTQAINKWKVENKPAAQQTQIRIGHLGLKRSHPDYMSVRLANFILGGDFTSRLNQRIRDDLGLTYSISSSFDFRLNEGPFLISTFSRHDVVGKVLEETLKMMNDFVEKGVTEQELNTAKSVFKGQFPAVIETADRYAGNINALRFYGVGEAYLANFNQLVSSVSVKQVNEAIKKYFKTQNLTVVLYTDKEKVMSQLKNPHFLFDFK